MAEKGSTRSKTRRCAGEYTLNDFLSKFELPRFVSIVDGYYTENSHGENALACGQHLTIHAVNKTGTVAAKTSKGQDVYISMDCCQLVELRPNGMKDFLDDHQYSLREIVDHFQFPLLVQFVNVQTENAVAGLYPEVLRLEKVIKDEVVVYSIMQDDETFMHVFPRSLDISVSLAQPPQGMREEKVPKVNNIDKLESMYEELQWKKIGNYMELKTSIQAHRSDGSIEIEKAPQTLSPNRATYTASSLETEADDDNDDLVEYEYPNLVGFLGMQTNEQTSYIFESNSTPTSEQSLRSISEMSVWEVAAFLVSHNLGCFANRFRQEEIDGNMLKDLDEESLKVLGLDAFQTKKLLKLIKGWKPKF